MKYGRLLFPKRGYVSPPTCNVGDIAQMFAIDLIYEKMGIPKDDIVEIIFTELPAYRGEKVLLPLNGYFKYSKVYQYFPTSPDIIPVFLGLHAPSKQYLKNSQFWNQYSPIGCRDEETYSTMKKYGYEAYLTGCMTMIFPKREKAPETPHVFVVDTYPAVIDYIPEELRACAEYVTHLLPVDTASGEIDERVIAHQNEEKTRKLYERYWNEATLVITSRLHCAAPCIAMGIPTIVVRDNFDGRFGWMDKFIHLYSKDEFDSINWNPEPIDLEDHKKLLLRYAISMINQESDQNTLQEIHDFYMTRVRKRLHTPLLVGGFIWLARYMPRFADFLRKKVLYRFTIMGSNKKGRS